MAILLPAHLITFSPPFSSCRPTSILPCFCSFWRVRNPRVKSLRLHFPVRTSLWTPTSYADYEHPTENGDVWRDSNSVEVIAIGSRKDALVDFCLEYSFQSTSLRFWTVYMRDSQKVQLLQRSLDNDIVLRNVECLSTMQSHPQATILVASAGYGVDHVAAVKLLSAVKLAGGLAVSVVLKPFSFEGQRRQIEVDGLVKTLQESMNFCIVVDTDALLKKEVVTLDEASRSANNTVLLAINAISVLVSDMHWKLLDALDKNSEEIKLPEILTLLGRYREVKVGFGADHNIKSSIARAVFDCPFLTGGLKDLDGIVICNIATAAALGKSDIHNFMHTFRRTTECTTDIIFSSIHEPNIEPNLIVITLLVFGCNKRNIPQKKSFLSGLALHFPFLFSFFGRDQQESGNNISALSIGEPHNHEATSFFPGDDIPCLNSSDGPDENIDSHSEELKTPPSNNHEEISPSRAESHHKRADIGLSMARPGPVPLHFPLNEGTSSLELFLHSNSTNLPLSRLFVLVALTSGLHFLMNLDSQSFYGLFSISVDEEAHMSNLPLIHCPGEHSFQREPLNNWNVGPGFSIAEKWANERAAVSRDTVKVDKLNAFTLPVGVKPSEQSIDGQLLSRPHSMELKPQNGNEEAGLGSTKGPLLVDTGFETVMDIHNAASILLKGKHADSSKKHGLLSARAASMLEAERDPQKKWSPIMEMQYRGGMYYGRCQGGLPEGKGRLTLSDGSCYDGMWRYGKRSGLGTFYYSNGDVFQGSWRDDLMHGKGWFYFHTGDRWFANFWKGKANGEGRFYSKSGNIFFGYFQDGWRHGHCLYIEVDGTRWSEIWNEGVLVNRDILDDESEAQ